MKKHLNLVWLGAFAGYMGLMIGGSALGVLPMCIVGWVAYYAVCVWILKQKNQSLFWILFSIAVPFLSNKSK